MKKDNLVPKIRFKGFSDPWEQRKLGDITERITRKNTKLQSTLPLTISAQYGLVDQKTFFDKQIASRDVSGYYLIRFGEFAYNKSYSNGYPVGTIKRLDKYTKGVLSTLYILFKPIHVDSQFLVSYFEGTKWYPEVMKQATEGARNHGLLNISTKDFFNMKLFVPNSNEQLKIGLFLQNLNNLIAANEDKLKQLKELKKLMMQKIFSQEWRFEGFTDPWEQRKLESLAEIVRGSSPRPIKSSRWFQQDSQVGWLRIADVTEQHGRIHKLNQHLSEDGQKKTRVLNSKHLLLSIAATVGSPVINYVSTGVHDGFLIFLTPKFELEFMFQWLTEMKNSWKKYGQPGSQVNLNSEIVRNKLILIPNNKEQKEIGYMLLKTDQLIAANEEKLTQLKTMKKFLMQNMFA
ncbi:restriction endonuclease subunit S [Lactiplantibacillus songbeiensis]|uniref:Restriction endonuclease subunit S n=1 Tax=Lactiplantibacillus songbeiensis TaxID=2559920 RepID=A0ABW4BZR4_9LACO|nr:restriction endonuclease subunit S [Lactiplantibacillus songbeiensis]